MVGLFTQEGVVVYDLANVVARALSVAGNIDKFTPLFIQMLLNYRKKFPGRYFVFALEGSGTLERRKIFDRYKIRRIRPTKEFAWARSKAKKIISCCNCTIIMAPKGEADDAIAIYVKNNEEKDIIVVSNDRDIWQNITNGVRVYATIKGKQIMVDSYTCKRILGVWPDQVVLLKALTGDVSDDIPKAVPRMSKKVILKLVNESGNVDKLEETVQGSSWLTHKQQKAILDNLNTIKQNAAIISAWKHIKVQKKRFTGDPNKLMSIANISEIEARTISG